MRVLLIAGRYAYGDPARGEGYEHQNFLPALRRLGHETEVFDHTDRRRFTSFIDLNRCLLQTVERWRPELVLLVPSRYEVWTETLDLVRATGSAQVAIWATDDSWKYAETSRFLAPHADVCVTTWRDAVPLYRRDGGANVLLSQWAADASRLAPPLPAAACVRPVLFIGEAYGNRPRLVRELTRAGIPVACFGHGWPRGPIAANAIAPLIRSSVVTLNFSAASSRLRLFTPARAQLKARIFEVPGCGGFLLSEWSPGLERCFDLDTEIDSFRNGSELIEKVKTYLQDPQLRDQRAERAHQRTLAEHTYDLRLQELLAFAAAQRKPTVCSQINWRAFDRAAACHVHGPALTLLGRMLVRACTLVWGSHRGPRAARKLVFELSWRCTGRTTYSAAGIPGRMFYQES